MERASMFRRVHKDEQKMRRVGFLASPSLPSSLSLPAILASFKSPFRAVLRPGYRDRCSDNPSEPSVRRDSRLHTDMLSV
jgi:hypothetical protein